jgi:hypothetical protein
MEIRQANIRDTDAIMEFIDTYWRKDHILAKHKEFFLYEFQNGEKLNMIIALEDNKIEGFLGFFYYNSNTTPHLAGSIWKTHPNAKDQLLGVKIRNYLTKNIKHEFFATPGPGLHMKPVYQMLRMNWFVMDQYYMTNDTKKEYTLISNPKFQTLQKKDTSSYDLKKAASIKELHSFVFDTNIVPVKDLNYIQKRYFEHPVYRYEVYYLEKNNTITNIIITRICEYNIHKACRIVDFFGDEENMPVISSFLYEMMIDKNYEYIDFISSGYNKELMKNSGFSSVDFDTNETVVPNYFEPFVQKNVPVYCVADKTKKTFRQHKADGDMDRPSIYQ